MLLFKSRCKLIEAIFGTVRSLYYGLCYFVFRTPIVIFYNEKIGQYIKIPGYFIH